MSDQKHLKMHTRLKHHISSLNNKLPSFQLKRGSSEDDTSDYVISYEKGDIYIGFLFNYTDKDGNDLIIAEQTVKIFFRQTLPSGASEAVMTNDFSISEIKHKMSNFSIAASNSGITFFSNNVEQEAFTLPFFLQEFAGFEISNKDSDEFEAILRDDINNAKRDNGELNIAKKDFKEATESYDKEFAKKTSRKAIIKMKAALEDLEKKEEALEKELTEKHRIVFFKDKKEGIIKRNHSSSVKRIKKSISIVSKQKLSVTFKHILNSFSLGDK